MMALFLLIILVMALTMFRDFIKFKTKKEQEVYSKEKRKIRVFMLISRAAIFLLVTVAIASPFRVEHKTVPGDSTLKILADNSTSFDVFERGIAADLKDKLEGSLPVTLNYIASGERSNIGDGILTNIEGDDNILIVSDGNNNYGRDLGDIIMFASMLNSTINMVDIEPVRGDVGIKIKGPKEVILGTENMYDAEINIAGPISSYKTEVTVNDVPVELGVDNKFAYTFTEEGYYEIVGELKGIAGDDYFPQNNVFYKTVRVVPRPKLLFVSEQPSQLLRALVEVYDVTLLDFIAEDINEYSAIVINDIGAEKLKDSVDRLTDYVGERGNGLFVVGGKNSYDKGSYKNSLFETLLPVQVGTGEKGKESDINIVLILDISGTSGLSFGSGSVNSKLDVEKAIALNILSDFRPDDQVAVIAFNDANYMVSQLSILSEKEDLVGKIKRLQSGGGTIIFKALKRAEWILERASGSKNIVVISDGIDAVPTIALESAKEASTKGIRIYTVGVGAGTNSQFLRSMAQNGNGIYFEPSESQNLKLVFTAPEEPKKDEEGTMSLVLLDTNHWITRNLEGIRAKLTGYNAVVPKSAAKDLVVTSGGRPIITVWRFGLGRVVSLSTDDGSKWAGEMLSKQNSKLITRAMNWAIGDLKRNKAYDVSIDDTTLGKPTRVDVVSDKMPEYEGLFFSKADVNFYSAEYAPKETGFKEILGAKFATNYNDEYEKIGVNQKLKELVTVSGGIIFDPADIQNIVESIRTMSKRTKVNTVNYRWPFALAALILLLAEIVIRRLDENKNIFK